MNPGAAVAARFKDQVPEALKWRMVEHAEPWPSFRSSAAFEKAIRVAHVNITGNLTGELYGTFGSIQRGSALFARGYAMVTQVIFPKDPKFRSGKGKRALLKEMHKLFGRGVFKMTEAIGWSEAWKRFPTATIVTLHPLLAVKHTEPPGGLQAWGSRIVEGGHNIRDAPGNRVTGREESVYVLPPGLAGIRTAISYAHYLGPPNEYGTVTADGDAACVHLKLGGPPMFARLDKSLRPESWDEMSDPCTQLGGALYGVPRAGKDWGALAEGEFTDGGFSKARDVEGFTDCKKVGQFVILITIYIRGLFLGGHLPTCWN